MKKTTRNLIAILALVALATPLNGQSIADECYRKYVEEHPEFGKRMEEIKARQERPTRSSTSLEDLESRIEQLEYQLMQRE